jgi:hypothetical protein
MVEERLRREGPGAPPETRARLVRHRLGAERVEQVWGLVREVLDRPVAAGEVAAAGQLLDLVERAAEEGPRRAELLLRSAELALFEERPLEADGLALRAETGLRRVADPGLGLRVLRLRAEAALALGDPEQAQRRLIEARRLGGEGPWLQLTGARLAMVLGELGEAAERLAALAVLSGPAAAWARLEHARLAWLEGDLAAARARAEAVEAVLGAEGLWGGVAEARLLRADLERVSGEITSARSNYQEVRAWRTSLGSGALLRVELGEALLAVELGQWRVARRQLDGILAQVEEAGLGSLVPRVELGLALCAVGLDGRPEEHLEAARLPGRDRPGAEAESLHLLRRLAAATAERPGRLARRVREMMLEWQGA